ncbi:FAD-dependent monooxygenase [Streptomyces sp. NPDC005865]|uniref:FAD-dependent monooxygenase n=1 Tax=Streptomyces sp. NPDC005865 TaxID=3155453 RepID=UPI0034112870
MVILGAGPAGLVLGNILVDRGIDCVVLERAERAHVQTRARAGFLAANTVRVLERHGLADGLLRNGRTHHTCEFRTEDGRFRLDYSGLGLGERHTVYPQQALVTDLVARFLERGGEIRFGTEALAVRGADGEWPEVAVREADGRPGRWRARYVAGCDGRHGAARRSLPPGTARHHRDLDITWLGLLADAPPSMDAVGYSVHERGFAGHMARTSDVTRYYLQCESGTPADAWSDERIWDELELRMGAAKYGLADLFDRSMAAGSRMFDPLPAHPVLTAAADGATVADIAGGNGELLGRILSAHPRLRGLLLERPHTVEAARQLLGAAGHAGRCTFLAGDFADVPAGADVYVLSRVLHDWDDDRCREILRHCARAMSPAADLLVVERVLPADGSPSLATAWDLHMMCNVGGRERRADHYARLFTEAGLTLVGHSPLPLDGSVLHVRGAGAAEG